VAGNNRIYDDAIASFEAPHALAHLLNDSSEFVPWDGRKPDPAVKLAAVDVKIGTTDARVTTRNQDFVRSDAWIGRVTETDISIVVKDTCFHSLLLVSCDS
jgi:hypothetical protein